MAKELKHKDAGVELARTEDNALDRHDMSGGSANDMLVYDGSSKLQGKTPTEVRAILNVADGADVTADAGAVMESDGISISNDGTKTTIAGTAGDYNRIGDANETSHSLNNSNDLVVSGKLEVNGTTYLDTTVFSYAWINQVNGGILIWDSAALNFGNDNDISISYEAADADALSFQIGLPHVDEAANNVACMVLLDRDATGGNLGAGGIDLAGITEPTLVVGNEASDAWCSLDAGDVNGAGKGLYFKAAADEDINLLKLSVTGTPTLIWDETDDDFNFNKGLDVTGNIVVSGNVDGRDVSVDGTKLDTIAENADVTGSNAPQAHKDLHDPEDGSDPVDTATPVQVGSANAIGSSHSLARADHVHEREHAIYVDASAVSAVEAAGLDLAENTAITLDDVLSADGKYCVTTALNGTAGEQIDFGESVYFKAGDSKWWLARGNVEATISPMTGLVIIAGAADAAVKIALIGEVRADAAFPALTIGAPVFIDPDTAGLVTTIELTVGEFQKAIGWAKTANVVVVTGNPDWVKVG